MDDREEGAPVSTLAKYTQEILEFRDARDWAQFHGIKDEVLSLASEVGELAELVRWHEGAALKKQLRDSHAELSDELADVLYWVLLIANDLEVNLDHAFQSKMKKNQLKYPVELAKSNAKKYTEFKLSKE